MRTDKESLPMKSELLLIGQRGVQCSERSNDFPPSTSYGQQNYWHTQVIE